MLRLAEIDNDWDRMQSLAGKTVMVVSNAQPRSQTLSISANVVSAYQ